MATVDWEFIVKKRLSWTSEMLQIEGTAKNYFESSLGINFEFRNAKMVLFYEFLDKTELLKFDEFIRSVFVEDNIYLKKVAERSYERCKKFQKLGESVFYTNWGIKTDSELLKEFNNFYSEALLMIPIVYFEPNLTDEIIDSLRERLKIRSREQELNEYFLTMTNTDKELTIIAEQRDLLAIGSSIQLKHDIMSLFTGEKAENILLSLPSEIRSRIRDHANNYGWINTDDMFGMAWTELDITVRLKYLLRHDCQKRLTSSIERQKRRGVDYKQMVNELSIEGELLDKIEISRIYSHLRTYRTEIYVRTLYQASKLLREVAKRINVPPDYTPYLSLNELQSGLISNLSLSAEEIERRKSGMAYIMVNRELHEFFGEDALKLAEGENLIGRSFDTINEIEGTIANMGIIRGRVKVVEDISVLDKVEDGDILVASMTIPEFVPAMEKSAAFVTDEGGLTCHAAIVSREMGVPCIIGTEIATRALRDGDYVEVDANNGIVRLLERNVLNY